VVQTKLSEIANFLFVKASLVRVASIDGTSVAVVAVNRTLEASAVDTSVIRARVEVVASCFCEVGDDTNSKLLIAGGRFAKVGERAILVVALSTIAKVSGAKIIVVTILY
jgi:hypothetical protein